MTEWPSVFSHLKKKGKRMTEWKEWLQTWFRPNWFKLTKITIFSDPEITFEESLVKRGQILYNLMTTQNYLTCQMSSHACSWHTLNTWRHLWMISFSNQERGGQFTLLKKGNSVWRLWRRKAFPEAILTNFFLRKTKIFSVFHC